MRRTHSIRPRPTCSIWSKTTSNASPTLLFVGAMPRDALAAALTLKSRSVRFRSMIDRIELAGYARRVLSSTGERIELTGHARQWIQTIWGPLAMESTRLLSAESTQRLTVLASMLALMRPIQEQHTARFAKPA